MSPPLVLIKLKVGETLYLYLIVANEAISVTLVKEAGESQKPIYFVWNTLQGAKLRYPKVEKMVFALITSTRRLR